MKKRKTAPKKAAKKVAKPLLKKTPAHKKPLNKFYKEVAQDLPEAFELKTIHTPVVFKEQEDYTLHEDPAPVPAIIKTELPEDEPTHTVILSMTHLAKEADYALEPFTAVQEASTDKETTESDLQLLNNHLALCNASLPHIHSVQTLCALSATVTKLIETRRKVKKLEYGSPAKGNVGRVFEVIE